MSNPTFPIETLPLLPLAHVLERVNTKELLYLSTLPQLSTFIAHKTTQKVDGFHLQILKGVAIIEVLGARGFRKRFSPVKDADFLIRKFEKLREMFEGPLRTLRIDPMFVEAFDRCSGLPTTCEELAIGSNNQETSQDAVDKILKEVEVQKTFTFNVKGCTINENKEAILSLDNLEIESAEWMTSEDLLKCDNKTLKIGANRLTEHSINLFIKKWVNGGNNRLEMAVFDEPDWDVADIVVDLEMSIFKKERRNRIYFPEDVTPEWVEEDDVSLGLEVEHGEDLGFALDITRADGTLASFTFNAIHKKVRFFVWKDRFPVRTVVGRLQKQVEELEQRMEHNVQFKMLRGDELGEQEAKALDGDNRRMAVKASNKRDIIECLSFHC